MRSITLVAAIVLAVGVCVSCDSSTSTPVSPTAAAQSFVAGVNGTQPAGTLASGSRLAAAPVGLTGVIRGYDYTRYVLARSIGVN